MNCSMCGRGLSENVETHYEKMAGWSKRTGRKKSASVRDRFSLGLFACKHCVEGAKVLPGQIDIFGEEAS